MNPDSKICLFRKIAFFKKKKDKKAQYIIFSTMHTSKLQRVKKWEYWLPASLMNSQGHLRQNPYIQFLSR